MEDLFHCSAETCAAPVRHRQGRSSTETMFRKVARSRSHPPTRRGGVRAGPHVDLVASEARRGMAEAPSREAGAPRRRYALGEGGHGSEPAARPIASPKNELPATSELVAVWRTTSAAAGTRTLVSRGLVVEGPGFES